MPTITASAADIEMERMERACIALYSSCGAARIRATREADERDDGTPRRPQGKMSAFDPLPGWGTVLAVVAHPDDESFGLGGAISAFSEAGAEVGVLCLTSGEASTLGTGELTEIRPREAEAAAKVLGVRWITVLDLPDGDLATIDPEPIETAIRTAISRFSPDGLLVFGPGGITGHPDHVAATEAAVGIADRLGIPVLGWVIPFHRIDELIHRTGVTFVGSPEADLRIEVDRRRQAEASRRHASQLAPMVFDRLSVLGAEEWLVWMKPPAHG